MSNDSPNLDIHDLINKDNIIDELDKDFLTRLAIRVEDGFKIDLESNTDWLRDIKKVEELVLLSSRKKTTPLPDSANVKLPLITKACYEYSSRTYPEIINDGNIVKTRVIGQDFSGEKARKAQIVSDYMNWQLYWVNDDWELELDRLLNRLALIGFLCTKTYYDPVRKKVKSDLCEPCDLIIHSDAKSLDDAYRITHILHVRLNELIEGSRAGIYNEEAVDKLIEEYMPKGTQTPEARHENPCIDLLEQHTFLDLDGDNYEEPYIITTVRDRPLVLRIVARYDADSINGKKEIKYIDPIQYFTDYHFLVSPRGKFQSVGFGILLLHINESANTVLNQLIDSGQLANLRGGFIDARLKFLGTGDRKFDPGQYNPVKTMGGLNMRDGILPIDYKEPSSVLYQLLNLLIDVARDLSASSDAPTGRSSPENAKTGATQALIAEGVKIHTSINKRVYRSLGNNFFKIFRMNSIYLDPQEATEVLNQPVTMDDFNIKQVDVIPVADPNLDSAQKKAAEVQKLMAIASMPGIDPLKVTQRVVKKIIDDHPEDLFIDQTKPMPPNPEVIKMQAEIQNMADTNRIKAHQLDLQQQELNSKSYEMLCRCIELKARARLELAQAASVDQQGQIQSEIQQLQVLSDYMQHQMDSQQMAYDYQSQQSAQQHEANMQFQQQNHEQNLQQQQQLHDQNMQQQQFDNEGQQADQNNQNEGSEPGENE